ncbi:MAG: hypothetical protein ACI89J_001519 [Hyphomicrobiaceae bacterium]|jgi:hypothetical protein
MGSLFDGLGKLLKETEPTDSEVAEAQCAMDLAMQAAIEKHAARDELDCAPSVKVVRRKSVSAFGRRGA